MFMTNTRILLKSFQNKTKATIDLAGNPKGIYYARLLVDGEMNITKLYLE